MNQVAHRNEDTQLANREIDNSGQVLNGDILVPRLFLMQALSDLVVEEKARPGQIIRSTTNAVLGSTQKHLDIIPLAFTNEWLTQEKVGGKYEWRGVEPRTAANDDLPWEYTENGAAWKRTKTINLLALLPEDITAFEEELKKDDPDLEKIVLPVSITFRSTSFPAGKAISTFFAKAKAMLDFSPNVRPWHYKLPLSCKAEENDKGKFFVFEIGKSTKLSPAMISIAEKWAHTLSTNKVNVHTADEGDIEL